MNKKKFYLALIIFSLVGQIAWVIENMYFNVFIYKMFNASANDISLMVTASAIAATITTIIIGAISDSIGKRKIFICAGYILWGISILSFAFIRKDVITSIFGAYVDACSIGCSAVIIMDCVMTFFGSSANDACFNAWLTDSATNDNRGKVEGINSMMPLLAILVVFGGFMGFNLDLPESWITIYFIIGIAVLLIGILGFFIIEDTPIKNDDNHNVLSNIVYGFKPNVVKENKMLYLNLIAFTIFGIAIQVFMPYLILYYTVTLKLDNYVLIMAPAIIIAAIVTFFYGRYYDKVKFNKAVWPQTFMLVLGFLILYLFDNTILVFIGSLLMMSGYLSGMTVYGAIIRENIPENKAGMFQGLRIVGQVLIPGIIGPSIGAFVLRNAQQIINDDGTSSFIPNRNIYLAALLVCVVLICFLFILTKRNKQKADKIS